VVGACLSLVEPDVIGTQEGLSRQIRDLEADHPRYAVIGAGRDADGGGETLTVLYRRDRLTALESGHFWLSDSPEIAGSRSWGNTLPRMTTWVRFRDHVADRDFSLVNTHLDHESAAARVRGAELICSRLESFDPDTPVIVTGDFNAISRADPTYDVFMAAGFTDLRFAVHDGSGPGYSSFHGYRPPATSGAHIDWILARGIGSAQSFRLVDTHVNGQYPSDHFPLSVTLDLTG